MNRNEGEKEIGIPYDQDKRLNGCDVILDLNPDQPGAIIIRSIENIDVNMSTPETIIRVATVYHSKRYSGLDDGITTCQNEESK